MAGRGEFVRLMFEEAGVTYEDVGETQGVQTVLDYMQGKKEDGGGMPIYAPPIIIRDQFRMCQMPAILQYLGKKYNMAPETPEGDARALQVKIRWSLLIIKNYKNYYHTAPIINFSGIKFSCHFPNLRFHKRYYYYFHVSR